MNPTQVNELLLQSLEHERGGVKVYKAAIDCALRPDLKSEWTKYLAQTEQHVTALTEICEAFGLDPFTTTPGTHDRALHGQRAGAIDGSGESRR